MQYTLLPGTQQNVSRLSLGTWAFSGAKLWGENDKNDSIQVIHAALDAGINLFDSASRYGNGLAEEILGQALAGRRDRAVVATKVYSDCLTYQGIVENCHNSLKRLNTDYVDLYQIHWPNHDIPLEEPFRAFEDLQRQGKIRHVSVCNFGAKDIAEAAGLGVRLNQLPYSLVWRVIEQEIVPACLAHDVTVWAYVPLAQGLLTGKYRSIDDVPLNRRETRFYNSAWKQGPHSDPGFETEIFHLVNQLAALCGQAGVSMQTLALAFLKSRPFVGSVLMGARSREQLDQNLAAFQQELPREVLEEAVRLSEPLKQAEGLNADLWVSENGGRMR